MASKQRTGTYREVEEEEYEDYEEVEIEEVEGEDHEEAFEKDEEEEYEVYEEVEIEEVEGEDHEEAFEKDEEEEYEDYEEVEIEEVEGENHEKAFEKEDEIEQNEEEEEGKKKVVEVQDYEEAFEEEEEEEVVIEQNEEEEEDEKKTVKVQDYEEAFEEEEEEEMEQDEEEEEDEKKVVKVQDYEEAFEEEEEEEEEMEQDEEEKEEDETKVVKFQDYEEAFEEEEEEAEMERNEKEEGEDEKRGFKFQKVQEDVKESVQDLVRKEEKSENPEPPAVLPPLFQSVSDLEKLHCALSKFLYQWKSLNRFLDSISAAIDAHAPSQHDARSIKQEKKDERSEQGKEKDERSWVEILCEEMDGKALLKYLESHFSEYSQLRHEVPEALRRLPNPEKLVFDAIEKFYEQSRRAYNNNTPLVSFRRASLRLLEFFVLSGRPIGDSSVKEEANLGALLWWKRLVNENIESASQVDSLGLILFLASFGIPKDFCSKDLGILFLKSNLKKKIDLFRRSSILVEKIPGVIKDLIREEMYFEAAELSCYFELTDTFPPLPLLSSFVAKVIKTGRLERYKSQRAPILAKEATIRELKSLRSVLKCMQNHNLDIHNLTSVKIRQKISDLEIFIEKDEMKFKKKRLKRKAPHLMAVKKSKTQSIESSSPSTSEDSHIAPSQMIQDRPEKELPWQPLLPDSEAENSALTVAVKDYYYYGWERKYYETSAVDYPSAQHFYQSQEASVYGNGGGILRRNLYQFADTVIQHEEQLRKRSRNSDTSPAGSAFRHY